MRAPAAVVLGCKPAGLQTCWAANLDDLDEIAVDAITLAAIDRGIQDAGVPVENRDQTKLVIFV
jgi:hypothetical protein